MAIIRRLKHLALEREATHSEVECTYSIIHDDNGAKHLQIDTYGSTTRQIPGKKSQSLRLHRKRLSN
jgi:hypothetical protein